jgi:hypothetical protein
VLSGQRARDRRDRNARLTGISEHDRGGVPRARGIAQAALVCLGPPCDSFLHGFKGAPSARQRPGLSPRRDRKQKTRSAE